MKKKITSIICCILTLLCLCALLTSCAKNSSQGGSNGDADKGESPIVSTNDARLLIYSINISLSVDNITETVDAIKKDTADKGGWVEYSMESSDDNKTDYCAYRVRIPTAQLDNFVNNLQGKGKVSDKSVSTEDITDNYVNATSRRASLLEEKASLQAFITAGGLNVSDVITVNTRIGELNTELNYLNELINKYDSLVNYSTVSINLYEYSSRDYTWIAIMVPYILLAAAVAAIVIIVVRNTNKKTYDSISVNGKSASGDGDAEQ